MSHATYVKNFIFAVSDLQSEALSGILTQSHTAVLFRTLDMCL